LTDKEKVVDLPINIELFQQAARLITSWYGVAIVCGLILLWAVGAALVFWFRTRPIERDLKRACRKLAELPEDEAGFAADFAILDEAVREYPVLRHAWQEFQATLIMEDDPSRPAVCNVQSPAIFFSRGSLFDNRLNLRFYNALPNLLTGTGILGTFIGLVAGIYIASDGLGSQDVDAVREALENLLGGASLAFFTSIAGLITSILFSMAEKHALHKLDRLRQRWIEGLDQRLRQLTPEQIARDTLVESRQQTAVLQQFGTELAFQIAQALEDKVTASMGPTMERMVIALEGLRQDLEKKDDKQLLRELVEKFSQNMQSVAGKELTALGETLSTLNERLSLQIEVLTRNQQQMDTNLQKLVRALAQTFRQGNEKLQEQLLAASTAMIADLNKAFDQILHRLAEDMGKQMDENARHRHAMDEVSRQTVNDLQQQISALMESLNSGLVEATTEMAMQLRQVSADTMERMSAVAGELGDTNEKVQKQLIKTSTATSTELKKSVDEILRLLGEDMHKQMDENTRHRQDMDEISRQLISELQQQIGTLVESLNKGLTEATSDMATQLRRVSTDTVDRLKAVADKLGDTVEQMRGGLGDIEEITGGAKQVLFGFKELQGTLDDAYTALATTAKPIQGVAQQFSSASSEIHSTVKQSADIAGKLHDAVSRLQDNQVQVQKVWAEYETRFDRVDQSLANTFKELEDGLARYSEQIKSFVASLDEHTGNIVRDLSGATEELGEAIGDLSDAMSKSRSKTAV